MKAKPLIVFFLFLFSLAVNGQDTALDEYIREGLESNHALRQKKIDYAISLAKLKESRSLFFPDIDFNARYTVARGGRIIEFPVGDLLNPVYSTLNMLTGTAQFPEINNQTFNFYREHEHETKISVIQPVFNTDIIYNYRIAGENAKIKSVDIDLYKNELVREIKTAYYECCKARSLLNLADSSILLVKENLRVSRRLQENDKVTIDAVYRSEAELAKAEAARARALNYFESSRSYFNFLLNRPLTTKFNAGIPIEPRIITNLEKMQKDALEKRSELKKISHYREAGNYAVKLHKGDNIPDISGVVHYGYQGEDYSFTSEDDFVLASLVLSWDLFQGMANKRKIEQAKLELEKLDNAYHETEKAIRMEVLNSYYAVLAAYDEYRATGKRKTSARKAYRVIKRKYEEGQTNLLELIDARTAMTEANSAHISARSNYFIKMAELEYARGKSVE